MVANGSLQWPIGVSIVVSLEYLIHPSPGYCGTIPVSIRSTIRPAYHIIVDIRGALTRWLAGPRSGHAKPLRYYQPTPPLASVNCTTVWTGITFYIFPSSTIKDVSYHVKLM
jgi:hypothetical protein